MFNSWLACSIYCLISAPWLVQQIYGELFTSQAALEHLIEWEMLIADKVSKYLLAEEDRIKDIKNVILQVEGALERVNNFSDIGDYLGNPLNSYLMLKRFNVEWKQVEDMLQEDHAQDTTQVFDHLRPHLPNSEDHKGVMDAIFRLQKTYHLKSSSLARGVINGVPSHSKHTLRIEDIIELGKHAFDEHDYPLAAEWLTTALNIFNNNENTLLPVNRKQKAEILDYLSFAFSEIGNVEEAYKMTSELTLLRPHDERIAENLFFFDKHLRNNGHLFKQNEIYRKPKEHLEEMSTERDENFIEGDMLRTLSNKESMMLNYEKLCRGKTRSVTFKEQIKLTCWYRNKNPLLRLKPQKVERLWVTPEILLFHDIITDKQSAWIKSTAYPKLARATIQDPKTGKLTYADYRVSKSAWLRPTEYPEVQAMKARTEAITGLDIDYAEELQVANYGVAGQYEPHFDHARDEKRAFENLGMGNRIATVLFYTSDVTAGGATVFTEAKATVYPVKNAAVFWFNLKRNGKGNDMTKHAACPVLVGQKWVSNWWIHEYGQEFRRPCGFNEDD